MLIAFDLKLIYTPVLQRECGCVILVRGRQLCHDEVELTEYLLNRLNFYSALLSL
jgi:hypothetical protein